MLSSLYPHPSKGKNYLGNKKGGKGEGVNLETKKLDINIQYLK